MKHRLRPGRLILLSLMGLVLGLSLYRWNAEKLGGESLPMPFGYGLSVVLTGSMEPTLSPGDLVLVQRTGDYAQGDVVVYRQGESLIIHRLEEIMDGTLITRGDANNVSDAPISLEAVKGEMIAVLPGAGRLVSFLQRPAVALVFLAAAFGLTELSYRKEKDRDGMELEELKREIRALAEELREKDD